MNLDQMMKQAQQFQQKLVELQDELAQKEVTSTVGGGMVTVTVNGKYEVLDLKIEKEAIDSQDPEMLQDLIVAAVNDALKKAQEMSKAEMGKLTGGMNIPGLF